MEMVSSPIRSNAAYVLIMCRALGSFGTAVATFGLEINLFKSSGSYVVFIFLVILTSLPNVFLSPVAGMIADRFHKGRMIAVCDACAIAILILAFVNTSHAELPEAVICMTVIGLATAETFRLPLLSAALPFLSQSGNLPRLNGLNEALRSSNIIFGPLLGLLTLQAFGLEGMLQFNIIALILGLAGMLCFGILFHQALQTTYVAEASAWRRNWSLRNVFYGLDWISKHSAFRRLALLFAAANCGFSVLAATITPFVLSFANPRLLAGSMLADGMGVLAGGALLSLIVRRLALHQVVLIGLFTEALAMTVWGMARCPPLVMACAFGIGLAASSVNGASQTIWQKLVPKPIQGRVFSARMFIATILSPIALIISLPLGTKIIGPFLEWNKYHGSKLIDYLWGTGSAASLGMMLSMLGIAVIAVIFFVATTGGLQQLETVNLEEDGDIGVLLTEKIHANPSP